ncbi:ASCH domain-containing protein [Amedibacillus sp. YH-ame10]
MNFEMTLWADSFEAIKNKTKTIEMRLNDEKRTQIQKDDIIEFTNIDTKEILRCLVLDKHIYQSFDELYLVHDKSSIGYTQEQNADPNDMLLYYSQEEIDKYGVMGIEVRVINE